MTYDVVVIGGGAAGLSGALTLSRARRSVLVIDEGTPRNAPADGVHNYLGREGTAPAALQAIGRAEVEAYGGEVVSGTVEALERDDDGFVVTHSGGTQVRSRRLLVATGLVDALPGVEGLAERWGRDVLHCPYCHGWEVRDQPIGVLSTGPTGVHQALLLRQWSHDVTLFVHTGPEPTEEQVEQLHALGIAVVTGEVAALEVSDDALSGLRLRGGEVVARRALAVSTRMDARAGVLGGLGLEVQDVRVGDAVIGTAVPADATGASSVPGVWLAGNVTDPLAQLISSAAAGMTAAAAINADLVLADTRLAVELHRTRQGFLREDAWEERYAASSAVWSGHPNPQLVAEVAELPPGTSVDLGCGEGGDVLWLAARGWDATGVDFSHVALERAAGHALDAGVHATWAYADLASWSAGEQRYDLVTAHFVHLPTEARQDLEARMAGAVAPGGHLLVVGHDHSDLRTTMGRPALHDMFWTAEQVAAGLDPGQWEVLVAQSRPRRATDPRGQEVTIADAVLLARRRA